MPWVANNGQYVWLDDAGRAAPAPVDAPAPPERGIATVTNALPPAPPAVGPTPQTQPQMSGVMDPGGIATALRNAVAGSAWGQQASQGVGTAPAAPGAPATQPLGTAAGQLAGDSTSAPLTMTPAAHAPGMEEVINLLRDALGQSAGGGSAAPAEAPAPTGTPGERAAADLESATAFDSLGLPEPEQGDPGARRMVQLAQDRQARLDPVIQRLLTETEGRLGERAGRDTLHRNVGDFGEWIGRLAAGERGAVLQHQRDDRMNREEGLQERILRLTEAGFGLQEATARAEAEMLSGNYQEGIAREERDYGRSVQSRELGQRDRQIGQGDRQINSTLALALVQALQQDTAAAQALNTENAGALLQTPGLESVGARALAGQRFGRDPALASAVSGSLEQRARIAPVLNAMIAGLDRGDLRQARRDASQAARRLGVRLTDSDLDQLVRDQARLRAGAAAQ